MNNPLDSFTVERLEQILDYNAPESVYDSVRINEIIQFAKIALAAKQAKAVAIAISPDLASAYLGNKMAVGQKLYTTPTTPQLPDGWVMVPKELTDGIGEAIAKEASCCGGIALDIYEAILSSAPKPE